DNIKYFRENPLIDECLDSSMLIEYFCREDGYAERTSYECPTRCENGACAKEGISCIDTDNGLNYSIIGKTFDNIKYFRENPLIDECLNSSILIEYYCRKDGYAESMSYVCPTRCENGACIDITHKPAPRFVIALGDDSPLSDSRLSAEVIMLLKETGYTEMPLRVNKLFSEVNALMLDYQVTLAIYNNEAVVIVGENSPDEQHTFRKDIVKILEDKRISYRTMSSNEISSPDLIDLFIEPSCTYTYEKGWSSEECSEEDCDGNEMIDCKTESRLTWRRRKVHKEVCEGIIEPGQCSANRTSLCVKGEFIPCAEDKICSKGRCYSYEFVNQSWHDDECDPAKCEPDEYFECESKKEGVWIWKKRYYREICIRYFIEEEKTTCGDGTCDEGETI
ncbi:hypothetical protein KY360_01695, partial [Candidatus Woesearchaeota archaeon]|nr:hypothetical protein [Candidatus Woesearchaeota archaeon]